jgi:hypothetical protein
MATLDQLKASLDAVNDLLQGDPTDATLLGLQRDCLQAIAAFEEAPVSYCSHNCTYMRVSGSDTNFLTLLACFDMLTERRSSSSSSSSSSSTCFIQYVK